MLSDLYHLAEFHACASLVRDIACSHVKVTGPSFGLSVFCVKKKKKKSLEESSLLCLLEGQDLAKSNYSPAEMFFYKFRWF